MNNMISLTVNDYSFEVQAGSSILEACKAVGAVVPRFCYHELLSIAGNCRMCLVEVEGIEKPVASCLTDVTDNMVVYTDSLFVKKARENVVETLLLNHPLDCPVCDQAGECDLQDQTKSFGSNYSKYLFNKRSVEDKDCGPFIKTIMTRCIHCTRCVRFSSEVAGTDFLGTFNRGSGTEIGGYAENFFDSEISGNVIDLCPVGALTSKPFAYKVRPWELRSVESIDINDSVGSNIYVHFKDREIYRILPKNNADINGQIISDIARFSYISSFTKRLKNISVSDKNRSINWTKFFKKSDTLAQQNCMLTVNENIGLNSLAILNKIARKNKNISLNSLNGNIENVNFYDWNLGDTINSINSSDSFGLIFAVNPKIECSTLNARVRTRVLNSLLNFITMNMYFVSNFSNKSINLNLQKSFFLIEGKNWNSSKKLNFADSPLVLMGESLKKTGLNLPSLISFLKIKFYSLKIIKINKTANSESLELLNIRNLFKKSSYLTKTILGVNLDNQLKMRKTIFNDNKEIYWFNTHNLPLELNQKLKMAVPILSEHEEERIFLNLEQRPQKTGKVFDKYFDSRAVTKILRSIFVNEIAKVKNLLSNNNAFLKNSTIYLDFLLEITNNSWLFDFKKSYSFLNYKKECINNSTNFFKKTLIKETLPFPNLFKEKISSSFL